MGVPDSPVAQAILLRERMQASRLSYPNGLKEGCMGNGLDEKESLDAAPDRKVEEKAERKAHFARMQEVAAGPAFASSWQEITREIRKFIQLRSKRRLTRARKIIAAGYYYSGSGALLDFVADHQGAMSWPEEGEVRFINLPWGVNQFYESVRSKG